MSIFQFVNMLATDKYAAFKKATVEQYKDMMEAVDVANCPCSFFKNLDTNEPGYLRVEEEEEWVGAAQKVCLWPKLHADIEEISVKGTYRGVPMGLLVEDPNRTRAGNSQRNENLQLHVSDIIEVLIFELV